MTGCSSRSEFPGRRCLHNLLGLSAVGDKEWSWMSESLGQHWGREGTAAWGSFPWPLKGSGIDSSCEEKAEPCSRAASLGDAKSQPRLFTTVFLSWLLALVSSVTTLWSASLEYELSFQLAGTLGLCCIPLCLPGLYCSSQALLYSSCRGFSQHIPCMSPCSVIIPLTAMVCDKAQCVIRRPGLCVLLFTLFASLSSWEYSGQLKGRA